MFMERRNAIKSLSNDWQYFSCLLYEGIAKILLSAFKTTCKIGQPIQHMRQEFLEVSWSSFKNPLLEFNFLHIFAILLLSIIFFFLINKLFINKQCILQIFWCRILNFWCCLILLDSKFRFGPNFFYLSNYQKKDTKAVVSFQCQFYSSYCQYCHKCNLTS